MERKKNTNIIKKIRPYLFLLPVYAFLIIFKYIPFGMALEKSFFKWNGGNVNKFVGLDNYIKAFTDKIFIESLKNGLIVTVVYIVIAVTIPLLAAELLFAVKSEKMQYVIRTAITATMVVPMVVNILLWGWILAGDYGILNNILTNLGLEQFTKAWLGNSGTALGSILAIGFPYLGISGLGGMQFLIYMAGLQNISGEIFEAAKIDGVNIIQRFIKIDLPMLSGQLRLMTTFAIIGGLQVFDSVHILTKGGPGISTMTPAMYIFEQGFSYREMGYSSALGIILFAIILILTVFNNKVIKSEQSNMQ